MRQVAFAILAVFMAGCAGPSPPSGGEAVDALRERYIRPRSHPGETIDIAHRETALDHLRLMHQQSGAPHLAPGELPAAGSSDCIWRSAGPTNVNGRVTAISIAANRSEVLFASSVGGVWRSTDRARRWQRVLGEARPGVFGAVAVDPSGQTVYAGGGDPNYQEIAWGGGPGIWRSSDGGDTWSHEVVPDLDRAVLFRLVVDPEDPAHVYAAASTGVWERSGGSWSRLGDMSRPCSDIAVDFSPAVPIVYAGIYEDNGPAWPRGVWKRDGTMWKKPTYSRFEDGGMIALALAPSDPQVLYAKLQKKDQNEALIVCRTRDAGQSWRKRSDLEDMDDFAWYNNAIAVDPVDPEVVWLGTIGLHRSVDGGRTWEERKKGQFPRPNSIALHVDQHAIVFDPANPNFLYVGNDGGIVRSSDMSYLNQYLDNVWRWESVSHGMVVTELYRIATRSAPATILAAGTQDNGTALTFGNRAWYVHPGSDGGVVAIDAANVLGVYESQDGTLARYGNPVPGRLDWRNTRIPWPASFQEPHDPAATDPGLPGYAAAVSWPTQGPRLKFTSNDGATWQDIPGALPADAFVTALAVAPGSSFNSFYVGYRKPGGGGLKATANRGTSWVTAAGLPNLSPNAIAVDADQPGRAFVAMGGSGGAAGGIYYTVNGGAAWQDASGSGATGLPETPMTGVVIDATDDHVVYASSFVGVFKGTLSGNSATWVPFDEGLPEGLDVNDIALNTATQTLVIGTRGYGAYQRAVGPGTCSRTIGMIRDNVFDRGEGAAVIGLPNPEDPVDPDNDLRWTGNAGNPANGWIGSVNWWTSTDIRVAVREDDPIPDFDHVEFESCPIWAEGCPEGVLRDTAPVAGGQARVFVQVTNPGLTALTQVRVTALWFSGAIPAPALPPAFWTNAFPPVGPCGPIANTGNFAAPSGWKYVDPANPCKTVALVKPGESEVVAFDWAVPLGVNGPFQYLALMESAQVPLGAARTEFAMDQVVPPHYQVAMRSLEVSQVVVASAPRVTEFVRVRPPAGPTAGPPVKFCVSARGAEPADQLRLFVPVGTVDWKGAIRDSTSDTLNVGGGFSPGTTFEGFRADTSATGTILGTAPVDLALAFFPGIVPVERPRYLNVVVFRGTRVYGGMTWVVKTRQ